MVTGNAGLDLDTSEFESQPYHFLAVCLCGNDLTSLSLGFLIKKKGMSQAFLEWMKYCKLWCLAQLLLSRAGVGKLWLPVLQIKFYWNKVTSNHLHFSYGCLSLQGQTWVVAAEGLWPAKPTDSIYYLALCKESLLVPALACGPCSQLCPQGLEESGTRWWLLLLLCVTNKHLFKPSLLGFSYEAVEQIPKQYYKEAVKP